VKLKKCLREKNLFGNSEEIGQKVGGWGNSCQTLGVVRLTIMIMKISPKTFYMREKKTAEHLEKQKYSFSLEEEESLQIKTSKKCNLIKLLQQIRDDAIE